MEKITEPVGVCEHAFVPVKPLSEMLKKCAACEKRKKWLWAKMTKCSHCKTVWHEQCALLHLPSVVAEPETESMTVGSESVAVSCTDQSMNEGDAFSSCTISTDVVPNPDSLATRGLQAHGVRDSSVAAAGSEPYGGKSIVDVIAAIRRARSTASKRRTRKTRRGRRGGVKKQTRRHKVITAILESIVTTVELCELYEELSVADVSAPGGHC